MADSSKPSSGESSGTNSRTPSVAGAIRNGSSRPKQNVKFSSHEQNLGEDVIPNRHNVPEIRVPEAEDIGDQSLSSTPIQNFAGWHSRAETAAVSAHDRATKHANKVRQNNSNPVSRRGSIDNSNTTTRVASPCLSPVQRPLSEQAARFDDIPLNRLGTPALGGAYGLPDDSTDEESDGLDRAGEKLEKHDSETEYLDEARRLVRTFYKGVDHLSPHSRVENTRSGTATPAIDQRSHEYDYLPPPDEYKPSVLSMLLSTRLAPYQDNPIDPRQQQNNYLAAKLAPYQDPRTDPRHQQIDFFKNRPSSSEGLSGVPSGAQSPYETLVSSDHSSSGGTPRNKRPKWYKNEFQAQSMGSLAKLVERSSVAMASAAPASASAAASAARPTRPPLSRKGSSGRLDSMRNIIKHPINHIRNGSRAEPPSYNHVIEVQTANIAERIASQKYLLKMCRALMVLGAPTHRLEEYMQMGARKLLVPASFQYLPGCMIVSFDDPTTHTTELHLVKESTAVDLGKLKDIQEVYKDVVHEKYSVHDAMNDIENILKLPKKFNTPVLIMMYGIAAVSVGPFAFSARPIDMPISFVLGCVLGTLQLVFATRSSQFSHIFEVAGTFVTSFAARGFGSIYLSNGEPLFCFSALAQSSIALILPGWIILSAALELQSRNLIAGSIRMVYAIIYTLFLGFGILIGTTIMGLFYPDSTNDITCHMPDYWNPTDDAKWKLLYVKFIWVPIFTVCLAMINQAKWKQMPWMVFIAFCGYQVNYWSGLRFSQNIQVVNALGALAIGTLANLYSRLGHGVAAAAMLPAIFVMVPSGLAASGSLVAGLTSANQITHNVTGISIVNNGTQGFYDAQNATVSASDSLYGGTIFNVGYGMVQVAIGISVGLFLSALVIYPFGKKRSGLFSF